MIPRAHVIAWRKHSPWSDDASVEQDLVISRALVEIFSEPAAAALSTFVRFRSSADERSASSLR